MFYDFTDDDDVAHIAWRNVNSKNKTLTCFSFQGFFQKGMFSGMYLCRCVEYNVFHTVIILIRLNYRDCLSFL